MIAQRRLLQVLFALVTWGGVESSLGGVLAEPILPTSIPNAPLGNSVSAVLPGDMVTDQYQSKGLLFPNVSVSPDVAYGTAVTTVDGVKVWAPVLTFTSSPVLDFGSVAFMTARLVDPGTSQPNTTSVLSLEIIKAAPQATVEVWAGDQAGNTLGWFQDTGRVGPHGGTIETFQSPGIESFSTFVLFSGGPWGIAEVDVGAAPTATPEPSAFVLFGLGMLAFLLRPGKGASFRSPTPEFFPES